MPGGLFDRETLENWDKVNLIKELTEKEQKMINVPLVTQEQ